MLNIVFITSQVENKPLHVKQLPFASQDKQFLVFVEQSSQDFV